MSRLVWIGSGFLLLILLLYQLWVLSHVVWWVSHNPSTSAFMDERLGILQEKNPDAELRHRWVGYDKISLHLKRAVIAAEDAKFVDHEGFDWEGMQHAIEKNVKKRPNRRRRLDYFATTGEEFVSIRPPHAVAQSRRSADYADARTFHDQAAHLRDLPECHRMGQRRVCRSTRLRRPGLRPWFPTRVFTTRTARPVACSAKRRLF